MAISGSVHWIFATAAHHHAAHYDQRGRRRLRGESGARQWSDETTRPWANNNPCHHIGGNARSTARRDASGTFDITDDGRRSGYRTGHRRNGVAVENPVQPGDFAHAYKQAGLLGDGQQGPDVIEQIRQTETRKQFRSTSQYRRAPRTSSCIAVEARSRTLYGCGCQSTVPVAAASPHVASTPIRIAAFQPAHNSTAIASNPNSASSVVELRASPRATMVAWLGTTMPLFRNPDQRDEKADARLQPRSKVRAESR